MNPILQTFPPFQIALNSKRTPTDPQTFTQRTVATHQPPNMAPSGSNKSTPTRKVTPWPSTSANASTRKQNTARRQQTTSQATAVALTGREKQLVFACEWHFTPEAVLAVKEMFEGLNDGRVVSSSCFLFLGESQR